MKSRHTSDDERNEVIQRLRRQLKDLRQSEIRLKRVEMELSESEQRQRSVIDGSPIPAFVIGRDHRIIYWNKALEELSRIGASEVIGTTQQWRAFYTNKRPCMADLLVSSAIDSIPKWYEGKYTQSSLLSEAYEATDYFPALGESGKWLRFTAAVIRGAEGELVGAIETLEDITKRKHAEAELMATREELEHRVALRTAELARANEALLSELMERHEAQKALKQTKDHLSLLLESLPIISYTRKADGHSGVTFVSNSIEEITGFPALRFTEDENFWAEHIHPEDRARVMDDLEEGLSDGTHRSTYRFRVMDDSYRWFSDYWRVVQPPGTIAGYIVGVWQDVTEDRRIRQEGEHRLQQLIQTHKLTALGEVVAGVAHEINNPVSFIAYNVPVLEEIWSTVESILVGQNASHPDWERRGLSGDDVGRDMREIIEAFKIGANRISRVVISLKEFSRSDEAAPKKPVHIPDVIAGALVIVGAQIRRTVSSIIQNIDQQVPTVNGHFQKIEQVIANLLINAYQAIPDGRKGEIRIGCRYIERLDAIVVDIEDNGIGIEREILDHIFDPFFTTRRDRDGTGLGLSISYGLVKEQGGHIGVMSRPGKGTRFSVYLPIGGEGDIVLYPALLCIDHNVKYLKELKANFVDAVIWRSEASDRPEDILQFLADHPEVDIVLSEVRLKGFDAWELFSKIRERHPLMGVILYSADKKVLRKPLHVEATPDHLLHKPFRVDALSLMIHELGRQQL